MLGLQEEAGERDGCVGAVGWVNHLMPRHREHRTHCPKGHEYAVNGYPFIGYKGREYVTCLICKKETGLRWVREKRKSQYSEDMLYAFAFESRFGIVR